MEAIVYIFTSTSVKNVNYLHCQIDVSFLCVCPVIDHEFRHHIVKVTVDPRGESRGDPQTTLTML